MRRARARIGVVCLSIAAFALAAGPAGSSSVLAAPPVGPPPEVPDDPPGKLPPVPPSGLVPRSGPVARGTFTSVQVNVDAAGNNIPGDAANESSIAVDPTNPNRMAIGWRQFDTVQSNFRQAGVAYTTDGGQNWTFPGVLDPGQFRSDPVLGSDPDGNFFYSSLSTLASVEVFKSTDGGMTWQLPVPASGGDKQWMTLDRTNGIGRGNIYQIWNVQFTCCPPNDFTRSTNGGLFFESPIAVPQPSMKWGTMDVGPGGTLYLAGATLGQSGHLVARSANAQDPFQGPTFDFVQSVNLGGPTAFGGVNPAGLLGQVWIAADPRPMAFGNSVFMLGSVDPPGPDPVDVMFIRSVNGGQTWSSPVRVNDDPIGNGAWQWFGTMSVAPNGRIDVIWNDTRNDANANFSELFYSYSTDLGSTWSPNIAISPSFNHSLGYPQQNKLGDYYHMVSLDGWANLAYAATFNGEQDVYYLRIAPDCNGNGIHDATDLMNGTSLDCNANGVLDGCEFVAGFGCSPDLLLADLNCDGATNGSDIPGFVGRLVSGAYTCQADIDQDGMLTAADMAAFVNVLLGLP